MDMVYVRDIMTAINQLNAVSSTLERAANNPKEYNSDLSGLLEQFSWESYRMSNQIKAFMETGGE